jgi:hypothetical protein
MIGLLLAAALFQGTPSVPIRSIEKGAQSFVDTPRQITARTPEEWAAAWKLHAPSRPVPAVDFTHDMVVGVFLGSRSTAGYSVEIVGVESQPEGLVVRYRETAPARSAITAQIITSPYHLVAVPKQAGAVRFEKVEN